MAKKKEESNLKKAVSELFGSEIRKPEAPVQPPENPVTEEEPVAEKEEPVAEKEEPRIDFSFFQETQNTPVIREEAVIPADMVITGNIITRSDMRIEGNIIGDVECDGNICLRGSIEGNISAGNLTVQCGGLSGDAFVKENVVLEKDSALTGNISALNIYANAKVEGQMKAAGMIELKEHAVIHGDISSQSISIHTGAKLRGLVNVGEQ